MIPENSPFAEIEIQSVDAVLEGQKITPLVIDPVREKFYDMRSLAPNNPDEWHNARLFYRQGQLMKDFTDDYDGLAPLSMHAPTYQRLGYDQLRTYFTWRTKVRQGEFPQISPSYVYLYIYELINGIGIKTPKDGLDELMTLWNAYRASIPVLDKDVPAWLKDYHIYYDLPHSFVEFMEINALRKFYCESTMFDLKPETALTDWCAVCEYDMTKSKFYNDGNQALMRICFYEAVIAMEAYCKSFGKTLEDIFYHVGNMASWNPFDDAMFYPLHKPPDKVVRLFSNEVYTCSGNRWATRERTPYRFKNKLMGYCVGLVEKGLCKLTGHKPSRQAGFSGHMKIDNVLESLLRGAYRKPAKDAEYVLDAVITEAYRNFNRIVVTVDTQNLSRIREEAEITQEKLVVDEAGDMPGVVSNPIMDLPLPSAEAFIESSSPWLDLKDALTRTELDALKVILKNPEKIKSFADENGVMLEILADGINEKAMDTVGDNILELSDTMEMYEDYLADVAAIIA